MSHPGQCRDINGIAVNHGVFYVPGPGECHHCVCESGIPKKCEDVMCHQPENCTTFRKGARCCDFVCLDDIPPPKPALENDFGLRLIASVITAILSVSLLFFLIHRLRQRKIRSGRQNRPLSEDERSLGSIGYITGSLGYLPSAMERYEEPTAHFPHYPLWKPQGSYFPRGEAPPPYEEAVAATRAEALAVAMASGNLHTTSANFSREAALLGVNYNAYAVCNSMGGAGHRTIPMNLATSASFTLQPERFDEAQTNGGTSCVSVATGSLSVTATVTAPAPNRPDMLNSDIVHVAQAGDPSSRTATLRRGDGCARLDLSHRAETGHHPEVHRTDISHRLESGHKNQVSHCSEESSLRSDPVHLLGSHRSDVVSHRHDFGHHEVNVREDPLRQDGAENMSRLPAMPPPESSHSLPLAHHHHHAVTSYSHLVHQPSTIHSHSHSHQHQIHHMNVQGPASRQASVPLLDTPVSKEVEQEERIAGATKVKISQFSTISKPGAVAYEEIRPHISSCTSDTQDSNFYSAQNRRTKLANVTSHTVNSLTRRGLVPVATPTLSHPPVSANGTLSAAVIAVPPPTPSASSSTAAAAATHVSSCPCPNISNARCNCESSAHSSVTSLNHNDSAIPQSSNLSLNQSGFDDNDDYRSECENCKSTHSSNYYLDAEDPEPEITMTLHRKPTESGEENASSYYRTSLTLPTRHRVVPLHGSTASCGARENWFSSMPESSTDESEED